MRAGGGRGGPGEGKKDEGMMGLDTGLKGKLDDMLGWCRERERER
jgi:hypothetical protein